jgi:hypothetical protein
LLKKYNITFERLLIILIVIIAAFLRFWHFGLIPFMHDEFSAIFRTWYDSLSDVIEIGVKQNDTHPAGVQIFIYYWIKLFGLSEPALKFPFALMGVGSVFMIWLIAKRWFNTESALFSALIMAITQYNIFYSQLARPYAAGLFFTLMAVWFWTKIVFDDKPGKAIWIWFVLIVSINSYIHAFTLFFNLMMGATGLLIVRSNKLKQYLISGVVILILFIPGIPVFMAQLGRGDIGGWLAVPKLGFLLDYFFYLFHFSQWFLFTTIAILLFLSVKYFNQNTAFNKFRIIGVSWFIITFLVAYLYSVYRSPIIQYSTLLFVFPFLLITATSFIDKLPKGSIILALALIMFTGVFTLVFNRLHYIEMYQQGFDRIPAHVLHDLESYQNEKVAVILQSPDTRMFDYYFEKYGKSPAYLKLEKSVTMKEVYGYLKENSADVVLFGCADYAPLSYLESIKASYPFVGKKMAWFNSEYWVLSKKEFPSMHNQGKSTRLLRSLKPYSVFSKNSYGKSIVLDVDTMNLNRYDVLNIQIALELDSIPDALLVIDWRDTGGEPVFWSGAEFRHFVTVGSKSYITISLRLMDLPEIPSDGEIKFYVWKKDKSEFVVQQMIAYITHINSVELGLYEKFP